MNIATRILLIFSIVFNLLAAIVISMSFLADSRQKTADAERQLHSFYKRANQLRQSSDDLTRMARTYVMTGDKIYQEYYFQILGIRDGKLPRPRHYEGSYWDFITAKEKNEEKYGPPMSLFDQMKQAGITEQELAILMQSKEQSDALSKMEQRAFGAMTGLFPDTDGKLTVQKAPDPDYARKLLHSDQYHRYKAKIMHPITNFNTLIQERVFKEVEENRKTERLFWTLTALLIAITILFAGITFLFFKYRVLKPIVALSNVAHRILSGDLNSRAVTKYQDEIGVLSKAFNAMIDARLKAELKLEISEKSLKATLNAIGDAMISTDIHGHITRMNPVAEKMTGWELSEALGKPLSEVCNIINTKTRKPAVNPVSKVINTGEIFDLAKDTTLVSQDRTEYQIADSAAPIWNETGDITGVVLVFQDVTDEYAVRERLRKSEEKFKRLFENSEVSICNEDLSEIKIELERLRDEGVTDIRQYLKENSQLLWELVNKVKIIQVNEATLKLFGATSDNSFIRQFDRTFGPNAIDVFTDGLCAIWDKKTMYRAISEFCTLDGTIIKAIISYPIPDNLEAFKSIPLSIIDITELKKTEAALIKSEERFRSLFENAVVSIWNEDLSEIYQTMENLRQSGIHDLRQYLDDNEQAAWDMAAMVKVKQVNNATLKLFKAKSGEEFIPQIDKTFGPSAINVFIDELCAIWDKKKIFHSEANFRTLDGIPIKAIISFKIPETPDGFKNIPVSIIDITDLKRTEMALTESEERLSLHLKNTPLAVIAWDAGYKCTQWNPAAEKLYGYSQKEALGKTAEELLLHDSLPEEMDDVFASLINQEGSQHRISESFTKDGQAIICEWFYTPLIDKDGTSIGMASMGQDITKIQKAAAELRKLSIAVEQSPTSIVITNAKGFIEYVNPKFEDITGYSAQEVIGQHYKGYRAANTTEAEYEKLVEIITSGKQWRGELQSSRKDGSLYWNDTSISPITDIDNNITHFLVVKEDITERRQLEDHFRRSQKMEAIGELAGGIAHDFNNLLGIIIGNLDLMKRNVPDDNKLLRQLEKAQNAALRGASLTRRLLNFSQQSPEASSPVNINKIIRSLEDLVSKSLTRKIRLDVSLAENLWMTELNAGDFEDMLVNLSLNARDAMPNGGILNIETRNTAADDIQDLDAGEFVEIIISDTGAGMSKETSAKIFDPFFTTKAGDKGTGLGLTMVYSFIQRSKGHISVYSKENIGTTFRIFLPRSLNMAGRMKHSKNIDETLPRGNETILIVDDEEELTLIAQSILDKLGYTTICTYSADEALQILGHNTGIDLLFSDVIMAGSLNGFGLARAATKKRSDLKILLTSGHTGKIQGSDNNEKWGKTLIAKPYRDIDLAKHVRRILDEKG